MIQCRAVANNNANEKMGEFLEKCRIWVACVRPVVNQGVRKWIINFEFQVSDFDENRVDLVAAW